VKNRIRIIREQLQHLSGICLDFGSAQGPLHKKIAVFPRLKFIGTDMRKNENVNIMCNFNSFPFPFKDNCADCITAGEIIEHLPNQKSFIKECRRILKIRGKLIITTPNRDSWPNRLLKSSFTHSHLRGSSLFNRKDLIKILTKHNFKIKQFVLIPYTEFYLLGPRGRKFVWLRKLIHGKFVWLRKLIHVIMPKDLREQMICTAIKIR